MKKFSVLSKEGGFNKPGFLPFLITFLFVAALQLDMKAQTTTAIPANAPVSAERQMYTVPAGPFVPVSSAQDRLLNAMKALKDQMANMAEGTAPFDAAYLRLTYYSDIKVNLDGGKGVAQSIVDGLAMINSDLHFNLTPQQSLTEKNAAIALLKL